MAAERSALVEAPAAGCVVALPGARQQALHRDGAQPGLVNAFIPLVDLTVENGPTALLPRTHRNWRVRDEGHAVAPLLRAGEVLLFDYRCLHHGLANQSEAMRPVAYIVYAGGGARDRHNFPADVTLRDYCARMLAMNARLDATVGEYERIRAQKEPAAPPHRTGDAESERL